MRFSIYATKLMLLALLITGTAQAVPELRETRGDYSGEFVTIFPDHRDKNLFYFLPNSSRFALHNNGMPAVGLTLYGMNQSNPEQGGGILSFVLRAGMSEDVHDELMAFKEKNPNARLSVVPFGKSYVSGPDQDAWASLVRSVDLPPSAGVAETEVGVNMLLTQAGARAFRGIIKGATTPFNVQLCFDVYGALPTMDAKVTVNYERVYKHFAARSKGRYGWVSWDVRAEVEKLTETGDIVIDIIGGDAKFDDYIKALADEFIQTYMTPTLEAKPGSVGSGTFAFSYTHREERKEVTARIKKQQFINDERCLPLSFKNLKRWSKKIITETE